jgi:SAM-dependent methyltransferase
MSTELNYRDYVTDADHMQWYSQYQRKYATTIRESDKMLIDIVRGLAAEAVARGERPRLLDIGCSTGNLLLHLKRLVPGLQLTGGDMASGIIAECRANGALAGIDFAEMNMLDLTAQRPFDIVVANAALMFFSDDEFEQAIASISRAITPRGWFVAFDLFHPFDQEVAIVETTSLHPRGLKFYFRSFTRVRRALAAAGQPSPELTPFRIPIDLPRPSDPGDVTTYTVTGVDGTKMSFRGTLFQPWCHVVSRKSS